LGFAGFPSFGDVNFLLMREQLNRANFLQVDRQRFVIRDSFRFFRILRRIIGNVIQLRRQLLNSIETGLIFFDMIF